MGSRTRKTGFPTNSLPILEQYWTSSDYPVGTKFAWASGVPLWELPASFSKITDVVGNQGSQNPVDHLQVFSSMTGFNPWRRNNLADEGKVLFEGIFLPLYPDKDFSWYPWVPIVSSATLSDWAVEAFNSFHDQIPAEVSIPNFLWELREMKSMIPSFKSTLDKNASNNFLAFEFGVKPFIKDIQDILKLSESVDKRIKHLIAYNKQTSHKTFARTTLFEEPYTWYWSMFDAIANRETPTAVDLEFRRLNAKVQFRCGAKLYQDLSDLQGAMAQMKALAAGGGFNKPARVIWNAIPYSFVVDWFFHVGKLLDSLSVQPFGGTYEITNIMHSLTSEALYEVTQVHRNGTTADNDFNHFKLGVVHAKSYVRKSGLPLQSLFFTDGALSPKQLALSAAMLNQRRR
jgi:hypothetical protein